MPIITLNVNELNIPVKRRRGAEENRNHRLSYILVTRTLQLWEWEEKKVSCSNKTQKEAGIAMLISNKTGKVVMRDKEGH